MGKNSLCKAINKVRGFKDRQRKIRKVPIRGIEGEKEGIWRRIKEGKVWCGEEGEGEGP